MSCAFGVRSTSFTDAGVPIGTSVVICSGHTELRAAPTESMAPANWPGVATSRLPVPQTICDSARAARTSGGMGGVHAARSATVADKDEARTIPRNFVELRDIVLTFVIPVSWVDLALCFYRFDLLDFQN